MAYTPKPPPISNDPAAWMQYVYDELQSIAQSQQDKTDSVQFTELGREPKKPRAGMVIFANGTDLDPALGKGAYEFNGEDFIKLSAGDYSAGGSFTGTGLLEIQSSDGNVYQVEAQQATVATPTITPDGGTDGEDVEIATTTSGARVYYTTNGVDPTESDTLYTGPIDVSGSVDLKAKAFKTGWIASAVKTSSFTTVPTANLVRHWKLNTGLTQAGGTASAWEDQVGAAALAQADGSRQPAVQASGSLLFDGSNDGMQWVGTLNMPCAILLRCRFITWSSAAGGDFLLNGGTLFTPRVYQDGVTPDIYLTAGGANLGPLSPTLGTWVTVLVNLNHSGANSYLHVEGVGTTSTGATGINNPGGITLGANGSFSGNYGNVEVAEVLVYDTQFTNPAAAADAIAYMESISP
jgi:hypothetical protein